MSKLKSLVPSEYLKKTEKIWAKRMLDYTEYLNDLVKARFKNNEEIKQLELIRQRLRFKLGQKEPCLHKVSRKSKIKEQRKALVKLRESTGPAKNRIHWFYTEGLERLCNFSFLQSECNTHKNLLGFWKFNYSKMLQKLRFKVAQDRMQSLFFQFTPVRAFSLQHVDRQFCLAVDTGRYRTRDISTNTIRPIPGSPELMNRLWFSDIFYVPIQTTWFKNIYQQQLSDAIIYNGDVEKRIFITHVNPFVLHEEKKDNNHYRMFEGYGLFPKATSSEVYTLYLQKVLILHHSESLESKESFKNFLFKHPGGGVTDAMIRAKKIMSTVRKVDSLKTIQQITNEKNTFREMYRGLTPPLFS